MPSSSYCPTTGATLSAAPTHQPAPAPTVDGFQFAQPYTHTPAWAQRAATHAPAPEPYTIKELIGTGGSTSSAELFRQPLKPQHYRSSSAFVQKIISQLLETVDRRRPFGHLRGFVTPTSWKSLRILAGRSRAIMELAGPPSPLPALLLCNLLPCDCCASICGPGVLTPRNLRQHVPWSAPFPRAIRRHYFPASSPKPLVPLPQTQTSGWKSVAPTRMGCG